MIIGLFALTVILQSKKCARTPPAPRPAPSTTTNSKNVLLPLKPRESSGTMSNSTKIKLPDQAGYNAFGSVCDYTIADITKAELTIMYKDGSNQDVVHSTVNLLNSFTPNSIFYEWSCNSISLPTSGDYWLELRIEVAGCQSCCGAMSNSYPSPGTGIVGCQASPQTQNLQQGKYIITAKTDYSNWDNFGSLPVAVFNWQFYTVTCLCNCP